MGFGVAAPARHVDGHEMGRTATFSTDTHSILRLYATAASSAGFGEISGLAGDIMQGTGGIRKLRWAAQGRGKSGGARVIYYYHNESIPLFLLTLFGKGEKANLAKSERNDLSKFTGLLLRQYGGGNE